MSLIDLPTAKSHLRLDDDFPDEQVEPYLNAAEESAQDFLNRLVFADQQALDEAIAAIPAMLTSESEAYSQAMTAAAELDDQVAQCYAEKGAMFRYHRAKELARVTYAGIVLNESIKAGMLLILGHLFENRQDVQSGVSAVEIPMGSKAMLWPYRIGLGV